MHGLQRTNNYVEGWYRSLNNLMSSWNPTAWKFIEAIQKEKSLNRINIKQINRANKMEPSKKRKRVVELLVNNYGNREKLIHKWYYL